MRTKLASEDESKEVSVDALVPTSQTEKGFNPENLLSHPQFPQVEHWRKVFPVKKSFNTSHRYFIANRERIAEVVEKLGLAEGDRKGMKTTVVEAYPGECEVV